MFPLLNTNPVFFVATSARVNRNMQTQHQQPATFAQRIERYQKQRDEFTRNLQQLLTPAVEALIRKLYKAAELCYMMQPQTMSMDDAYDKLFANTRTWSDAEIKAEIGEKRTEDADISLQMVVKSHATVLALSTARRCKEYVSCPNIIKFFRNVMEACVAELSQPDLFNTFDIDVRAKVRAWIDQIVQAQAFAIVPVGMFTRTASDTSTMPRGPFRAIQKVIERAERDAAFAEIADVEEPVVETKQPTPLFLDKVEPKPEHQSHPVQPEPEQQDVKNHEEKETMHVDMGRIAREAEEEMVRDETLSGDGKGSSSSDPVVEHVDVEEEEEEDANTNENENEEEEEDEEEI